MGVQQIERGLSQKWKDGLNYGAAGFLIVTAVTLAFVSFIITLTVGTGVLAWGGLSMGTALTLIGGGLYFHNQLVTFETKANEKMKELTTRVDKEIRRMDDAPAKHSKRVKAKTEDYNIEEDLTDE